MGIQALITYDHKSFDSLSNHGAKDFEQKIIIGEKTNEMSCDERMKTETESTHRTYRRTSHFHDVCINIKRLEEQQDFAFMSENSCISVVIPEQALQVVGVHIDVYLMQ
jgi:hypothetical protein